MPKCQNCGHFTFKTCNGSCADCEIERLKNIINQTVCAMIQANDAMIQANNIVNQLKNKIFDLKNNQSSTCYDQKEIESKFSNLLNEYTKAHEAYDTSVLDLKSNYKISHQIDLKENTIQTNSTVKTKRRRNANFDTCNEKKEDDAGDSETRELTEAEQTEPIMKRIFDMIVFENVELVNHNNSSALESGVMKYNVEANKLKRGGRYVDALKLYEKEMIESGYINTINISNIFKILVAAGNLSSAIQICGISIASNNIAEEDKKVILAQLAAISACILGIVKCDLVSIMKASAGNNLPINKKEIIYPSEETMNGIKNAFEADPDFIKEVQEANNIDILFSDDI